MKHAQPIKMLWLIIVVGLLSGFQGCSKKTPAMAPQAAPVVINKIEPRDVDGKIEITIEGTGPLYQYTSFQLTEPLRLVVDIGDANLGTLKDKISVKSGAVTDIVPSQMDSIARLEIGLSQVVDTKVDTINGKMVIEVAKPAEDAKQAAEAKPAQEAAVVPMPAQDVPKQEAAETPQSEQAPATVISSIKATAGKDGIKVVITANGSMKPNTFMVGNNRLVVDIPGVRSTARPSVIPVRKGGLDKVRVGQHTGPQKVRVVLDLTKQLAYTVTPEANTLIIAMGAVSAETAGAKRPQVETAAQEQQAAPAVLVEAAAPEQPATAPSPQVTEEVTPTPAVPKEAAVPRQAPPAPAPAKKERTPAAKQQPPEDTESTLVTGSGKFTGRKISLDLQDADLINVLRLFAEVANRNIIIAPDVKGKVTVRMVNIPWDQAMDIILRMNGLGYVLEDNVLRIASVTALTKEANEEVQAKEAKKKAEDLITRIVPVNYSTASVLEPTIKKGLSPRGETVVDVRTNTIIIKDIPQNVASIVALIKVLDKPVAQIMIDARVVEASLNFTRQIGVQWGGNAQLDAAHGNATGLQFPNSVGVTGSPLLGNTDSGTGNWLVNLPAAIQAGSGGALGISLASLNKAFNLDLVLSALESTGEGKIISQPKISALDNKEAKIEQGLSIPYSTTSASGTQIQFIDAKLALTVTPHATPDNKIFLKLTVTKNAPNTTVLGANGQPSISKNEATTEILLADGETAVIGGILTIDVTVTDSKVPFLGDIPIIGWLFKNRITTNNRGELLIFITPRMVKQEAV
jgi:type IV pilus assembly protein PilQ